jgi:hypothetical protein
MGSGVAPRDGVGALEKKSPLSLAGIEPDFLVFPVLIELYRTLNTTTTYCYTEFESPNITSVPEIGMVAMFLLLVFQS